MTGATVDELEARLPAEYPVSIVMECRCSASPWAELSWDALGITVGESASEAASGMPVKIHADQASSQYLYQGFTLRLHRDECESYYHNLMTPDPRCYVVARMDEHERPVPYLVSMSFDEAHAYLEAGDPIYAVAIPPEIYRWCEAYVLAHYVPERKYKRKLISWKDEGRAR